MTRQTWQSVLFASVVLASLMPSAASSQASFTELHSVFLEDLTWMEVRDAVATGYTTVIVPLGNTEQNGPYLAVGKHNYVVKGIAEATARVLGNAIVAPTMSLGPGAFSNPPSGHMRWPGTLVIGRETYQNVLADLGNSLRLAGFRDIVYISEHEASSSPENPGAVAQTVARLNQSWGGQGQARAHFIPEYRSDLTADNHAATFIRSLGVVEVHENPTYVIPRALLGAPQVPADGEYLRDGRNPDGTHEGYYFSAVTMAVRPEAVRAAERIAAGPQQSYGVDWVSPELLAENGRKIIEHRARGTADRIRAALARR